ncbi:MAG: energy transducer TonB [Bacteroidia bacterium]
MLKIYIALFLISGFVFGQNQDSLHFSIKQNSPIVQNLDSVLNLIAEDEEGLEVEKSSEPEPRLDGLMIGYSEPQPLNVDSVRVLIGYPNAEIEGTVIVRLLIDEEGNCKTYKLIKKAHPLLWEGVEPFIMLIRFRPFIKNGKPIGFWVTVPFNFKITD